MASLPVWCHRRQLWLVVVGEQSWNWKIHLLTFVRIGPKIVRENRSKFVTAEIICPFSTKSKMAENQVRRKLTSYRLMIQGFQRYLICEIWTNESKVIHLNGLQTLTCWWRYRVHCLGMKVFDCPWDCPEYMCQVSKLFTTAFEGLP